MDERAYLWSLTRGIHEATRDTMEPWPRYDGRTFEGRRRTLVERAVKAYLNMFLVVRELQDTPR